MSQPSDAYTLSAYNADDGVQFFSATSAFVALINSARRGFPVTGITHGDEVITARDLSILALGDARRTGRQGDITEAAGRLVDAALGAAREKAGADGPEPDRLATARDAWQSVTEGGHLPAFLAREYGFNDDMVVAEAGHSRVALDSHHVL